MSSASSDDFCLRWNDHHDLFFNSAEQLCRGDFLTDVTLSCGERHFSAHKLVLSVCSGYFADLFASRRSSPFAQTVVYLKDVDPNHLELILSYMYRGQINVREAELMELLRTAKGLKVKGLSQSGEEEEEMRPPPKAADGKRKALVVNTKKSEAGGAAKKVKVEERWSGATRDGAEEASNMAETEYNEETYDEDYYEEGNFGGEQDDDGSVSTYTMYSTTDRLQLA